jgi:hypothetical protein
MYGSHHQQPQKHGRNDKGAAGQDWADHGDITANCVVNALGIPVAAIRARSCTNG